jgi:hypothetical protein
MRTVTSHPLSRQEPQTIRQALTGPFAPWLGDDDWTPWFAFLAALRGEPLTADEAIIYRACTGRTKAPTAPSNESWVVVCYHAFSNRFLPRVEIKGRSAL